MDILLQIFQDYGLQIIGSILMGIAGYLGIVCKRLADKYLQDKTKQAVAKIVVRSVEQCYKDLHGDDKLQKALTAASEMLSEKGISCTDVELRLLLEDALGEFNKVFEKTLDK